MSTLEFISSLVDALAWPTAVVLLILAFRRTFTELLPRQVSRLKAGPVELEWEQTVVEVQGEVQPARELKRHTPGPDVVDDLVDLTARSPARAVLEGYGRVEEALERRLMGAGWEPVGQHLAARELARIAERMGVITSETVRAIDGVSVLRNLAAHRPDDVTAEQALEYLGLVEAILYSVSTWIKPDLPPGEG